MLKDLREALGNIPLLMTFRTSKEGGEKAIEPAAYAELNIKAAQTGYVDLIDVEIFTGDEIVKNHRWCTRSRCKGYRFQS